MRNIRLTIAYDGTSYAGWQVQKNAPTIQGEIEKTLRKILKHKARIIGAGRTDSGVHAEAQVANFRSKSKIPLDRLQAALNANLPGDIVVLKAQPAKSKFHSQLSSKGKVYRYSILNRKARDPFTGTRSWHVPHKLSVSDMRKGAKELMGSHDFKSFQAKSSKSKIKKTKRTIRKLIIRKIGDRIVIVIEANGFLHNMARNIVGTLVDMGRGYLPQGSVRKILSARDRRKAGETAPSKGLVLQKVLY